MGCAGCVAFFELLYLCLPVRDRIEGGTREAVVLPILCRSGYWCCWRSLHSLSLDIFSIGLELARLNLLRRHSFAYSFPIIRSIVYNYMGRKVVILNV